jgi:hypothetical protein
MVKQIAKQEDSDHENDQSYDDEVSGSEELDSDMEIAARDAAEKMSDPVTQEDIV